MPDQLTAEIIAFPRARRAPPAGAADPGTLQAALARLNEALDEQRRAIAVWRDRVDELRGSARTLQSSLLGYRERLHAVQTDLSGLHQQARRLEGWAVTHSRRAE